MRAGNGWQAEENQAKSVSLVLLLSPSALQVLSGSFQENKVAWAILSECLEGHPTLGTHLAGTVLWM